MVRLVSGFSVSQNYNNQMNPTNEKSTQNSVKNEPNQFRYRQVKVIIVLNTIGLTEK